jgi:hypothetical protein
MTEPNAQPSAFRFDDGKSFEDNCAAFLKVVTADDPDMATILQVNWKRLVGIVREGERDSKARGEFNATVASALDALVTKAAAPKVDA